MITNQEEYERALSALDKQNQSLKDLLKELAELEDRLFDLREKREYLTRGIQEWLQFRFSTCLDEPRMMTESRRGE